MDVFMLQAYWGRSLGRSETCAKAERRRGECKVNVLNSPRPELNGVVRDRGWEENCASVLWLQLDVHVGACVTHRSSLGRPVGVMR